jgi:uncharacterized membrane protein
MAPLIVLIAATGIARVAGFAGLAFLDSWSSAAAIGLGVMFLLTASAHFTQPRRDGLIAIVPRWIPQPALVITATGILELVGAAGLILPPTRVAAALCLGALLVAMFPANIRAAQGVSHPASPSTPLVVRMPIQALFLGALAVVVTGL